MVIQELIQTQFDANTRYQFVQIPAGGRATIYVYGNWGTSFRAFIDQVGNGPTLLPWDRVLFLWYIDGRVVDTFNYQIAKVKLPKHFEPPFVARQSIRWEGINNDVVPHVFEVLCDGMLVKLKK